jgi:hypothetical protein
MTFKEVGSELPEQWKPEIEGDFIVGVYIRKKSDVGKNKANLYIIEEDSVMKCFWGSTVLDDKMCYVNPGELIRITYKGEDAEKGYHKYTVERGEE